VSWTRDGVSQPPYCTLSPTGTDTSTCTKTFTATSATVYIIIATYSGSPQHASSVSESVLIVFYDPNAGFVTGGGYVNHNPATMIPPGTGTGKDNFGFVAKYKKGASAPDGETEFQCKVCDVNFHSTSLQWLVVTDITTGPNAGAQKAQYQGYGTNNGAGNYQFQVTVIDKGSTDYFRIHIWTPSTGVTLYDNMPGFSDGADATVLTAGGNIVIHK
jgi:hypothetical protein